VPIVTSANEGPIRGHCSLDVTQPNEIERLAESTRLALAVHRLDDAQLPPDFQAVRNSFSETHPLLSGP